MGLSVVVAAIALLMQDAAAPGDGMPQCKLTQSVRYYDRLRDLPKPLQAALRTEMGDLAEAGAPFNATDAVTEGLPNDRFARAGQIGDTWFVWVERGGLANNIHTLGFLWIVIPDHPEDTDPQLEAHFVGEPCLAASAFLDGVMTSPPVQ